jgi:hypothetical protein
MSDVGSAETEEATAGDAGEPTRQSAETTRAVVESGASDRLTSEQLDARQAALATERKPMGPPLEEAEDVGAAPRAGAQSAEVDPIDEPEQLAEPSE